MRHISTNDNVSNDQLEKMLRSGMQVWVRCPARVIGGGEKHWSRARLVKLNRDGAVIKPIKHGGRLERVPLSTLRLWKSMNAKQ